MIYVTNYSICSLAWLTQPSTILYFFFKLNSFSLIKRNVLFVKFGHFFRVTVAYISLVASLLRFGSLFVNWTIQNSESNSNPCFLRNFWLLFHRIILSNHSPKRGCNTYVSNCAVPVQHLYQVSPVKPFWMHYIKEEAEMINVQQKLNTRLIDFFVVQTQLHWLAVSKLCILSGFYLMGLIHPRHYFCQAIWWLLCYNEYSCVFALYFHCLHDVFALYFHCLHEIQINMVNIALPFFSTRHEDKSTLCVS